MNYFWSEIAPNLKIENTYLGGSDFQRRFLIVSKTETRFSFCKCFFFVSFCGLWLGERKEQKKKHFVPTLDCQKILSHICCLFSSLKPKLWPLWCLKCLKLSEVLKFANDLIFWTFAHADFWAPKSEFSRNSVFSVLVLYQRSTSTKVYQFVLTKELFWTLLVVGRCWADLVMDVELLLRSSLVLGSHGC